jgi:hypothetical protein
MNEEQMAAWMAVSAPSEEHGFLERMEGTWKAKTSFWMDPTQSPQVSEGTMTGKMILGGRFLQSNYEGNTPWGEFAGMALDGFDRIRNVYTGLWMDSMGTIMMLFEGECSGNVRTMICEYTDPTGKPGKMKAVTTIVSENEFKYESYATAPNGDTFKNMEVVYTR